jgi:hypothetical protein
VPAIATSLVLRVVQVPDWAPPSSATRLSYRRAETTDDSASSGYVANFTQEVVKGQVPLSVGGIRQPGSRTVQPQ